MTKLRVSRDIACLVLLVIGVPAASALQDASSKGGAPIPANDAIADPAVDALAARIVAATRLENVQVVALDAPINTQAPLEIPLDGRTLSIALYPHSLRSPDFEVLVPDGNGGLTPYAAPPITTYRGVVAGQPTAQATASVIDGELHMMIRLSEGDTWYVEPAAEVLDDVTAEWHFAYRADDITPSDASCGVDETMRGVPIVENEPSGGLRGVGLGRTEIGFDADFEFFTQNGSSVDATVADVEMILNNVSLIYQGEVGICYAITTIIVRTSAAADPYSSTDASTLLCEFTDHWNHFVTAGRDVAHLMTGKELNGSTIGVAWLGVVCGPSFSNCSGGPLDYGLSESRFDHPFSTPLAERIQITAHGLGHNWNAENCDQAGNSCSGVSDCGIMRSFITGATSFSSCVRGVIAAHRDTRTCLEDCFNPTYVDFRTGAAGNGSPGDPFPTVGLGVVYVPVGGTVIVASGTYPENLLLRKPVRIQGSGGSVIIGN
ncbi:MAG: hypothetical protein D6744_14215 [Planctomycetota bacterium]|nr:MAG: hypothetical protein D6744_14215 [Planctomycetota bacterium]